MVAKTITELRKQYRAEIELLADRHKLSLERLNKQLDDARKFDYSKAYKDQYIDFNSAMEEYYQKLRRAEADIHGLSFYCEKYLPSARVTTINQNVEDVFLDIVSRTGEIVQDMERPHSVDEYGALSRSFCDLFATMKYIVKNSDNLLNKSGLPKADRDSAVLAIEQKIKDEKDSYSNASKLENLRCYDRLVSLKEELENNYAAFSRDLLGVTHIGHSDKYRYLVGFNVEKVADEDMAFCESVLGVERSKIGRTPVYLDMQSGFTNLVINAPGEFLRSDHFEELIHHLYFSLASKLGKNLLQYGYFECISGRGRAAQIYVNADTGGGSQKKRLGDDGVFVYENVNIDQDRGVKTCLENIEHDCKIIANNYENFIAENMKSENDKKPLKMVVVNSYPAGFIDSYSRPAPYELLHSLVEDYTNNGYVYVICQDTSDDNLNNTGVRINAKDAHAIEINLTDEEYKRWLDSNGRIGECRFTINGVDGVMDIASRDFNYETYWDKLKKHYNDKKVYSLQEVFDRIDEESRIRKPSVFEDKVIDIPIGVKDGRPYDLHYNVVDASHTYMIGNSGYGKSSFFHSFILSLCYKYSAEEITIYLGDFKGTEFAFYTRHQLPHIKYCLSEIDGPAVKDMFSLIEKMFRKRNDLIIEHGCKDIATYNQKAKLCTDGSMKPMPMLFFIIDEFQSIGNSGGPIPNRIDYQKQVVDKIDLILKQGRSTGITLFVVGQHLSEVDNNEFSRYANHILLDKGHEPRRIGEFCGVPSNKTAWDDIAKHLTVRHDGRSVVYNTSGSYDKIKFAYAGETEADRAELVNRILSLPRKENGEKSDLILGGSTDPVVVNEYAGYHDAIVTDEFEDSFDIGVGFGSTMPVQSNMAFADDADKSGWAVYAKEKKSYAILRNAMISFLYKTAALGFDYSNQPLKERIVCIGKPVDHRNLLGDLFFSDKRVPGVITDNVKKMDIFITENTYDSCVQIMELYKEMDKRKYYIDSMGARYCEVKNEYPPYLIVFRSIDWDQVNERLKEHYKKSEQIQQEVPSDDPDDSMADFENIGAAAGLPADFISGVAKASRMKKTATGKSREEKLTADEVKKAFNELLQQGNRCGMFVIFSATTKEQFDAMNTKSSVLHPANIVLGALASANSSEEGPSAICYLGDESIKTRLFEYPSHSDDEWWNKLDSLMKGE